MNSKNEFGRDVRALVAEDNPAVREFVCRSLQVWGADTVEAEDGQKALEILSKDRFDVLVADIVMPNMDGISLALNAASAHPNLRIVLMSGYAQERMRAHNLEALVHKVIAKPFSLEEICEAVKEALEMPSGSV